MNSIYIALLEAGMLVVALVLFVLLTGACEVGFRVGRWRGKRIVETRDEATAAATLTGGMLALLAFMLGLTINFAQNRFEARRELVAAEANAIGTAWLRARMVGGQDGEAIALLVEDFAKARLEFTRAELRGPIAKLVARSAADEAQMWRLATGVARQSPTPISASLATALTEMFDSALSRRFAFDGRVPGDMLAMLVAGSIIAIGAMGYQMGLTGVRQPVLCSLLLLMWTGGIVTVIDLNRPRLGAIRVDSTPLRWAIEEFAQRRLAMPATTR